MIDENAVETVEAMIEDAIKKGGKLVAGGKRHELGGTFFEPTVIANAKASMKFTKEEIFGDLKNSSEPLFSSRSEESLQGQHH